MHRNEIIQVNQILQNIDRVYEIYAKSVGLSYMSLTVLQVICATKEPITQREICEITHYNKQIVNAVIKDFYSRNFLTLAEKEDDRRNKNIVLTQVGEKWSKDILAPLWQIEQQVEASLTAQERSTLVMLLKKAEDTYEKGINKFNTEREKSV